MCNKSWAHKVSYLGLNRTRDSYEKVIWSVSWRIERIWIGEGKSVAIIATRLRAFQCDGRFCAVTWQDVMTSVFLPVSNGENITLRPKTHILVFLFPVFCSYLYFNWNPELVFLNSTILFLWEGIRALISIWIATSYSALSFSYENLCWNERWLVLFLSNIEEAKPSEAVGRDQNQECGKCKALLDYEFCLKQFIEGKTSRKVDCTVSLSHMDNYYPFDPKEFMNLYKFLTCRQELMLPN